MGFSIEARIYLQHVRYRGAQQVAVTQGASEIDITFNQRPEFAYRNPDVAPTVALNWLTTSSIEPLPGQTDFKTGFRVLFGLLAPAGAKLNYNVRIVGD